MKSDKHLLMLLWAIYLFAIIVVVIGAGSEAIAAVLKSGVNQQWLTVAPIITPFVALAAVWVAYRQLSLNRKNQRETTAKATFREFLKLCVQYPDLADGKPTSGKQDEYEWFVAYFLWAAEEILEYSGKDWETNLRLHMTYHKDFLKSDQTFRNEDFYAYSGAVQRLILDVVGPFATTK
jgi:hypothetical protein